MLKLLVCLAFAVILISATGCNDGDNDVTPVPEATVGTSSTAGATPEASASAGIIAIGHSGLTGANTDADLPGQDAPENSWATGTTPSVNSVYQRLVTALPETEGHVANSAEGGAPVGALVEQAELALRQVPQPALVIIQTIDNDIRCDGTDDARVAGFGEKLAAVLEAITESSAESKILVVSQLGRPERFAAAVAMNPSAKAAFTGTGICDFFDPSGNLANEHVATLTAIIEEYEAEQARVCATVPQCSDDKGALAGFADSLDYLSDDWNHLNVQGLARVAEIMWPTVEATLQLP